MAALDHKMATFGEDRQKAVDVAITQIEKQFGKGAIMRLGGGAQIAEIEVIPSGGVTFSTQ